ncbi:MAG: YlbF family regulator [Bacilli bacterium]|nr:YlbF family regulator [Bacilli bacterium]
MNALTYRYLNDLRDAMDSDPRTKRLAEAETKLREDPEASKLFLKAETARGEYLSKRLELGEEAEETRAALKVFHEAKKALDLHPSAREYSSYYAEVAWLYREIDAILFGAFKSHRRCGGNHD